jgi:hypothetical protein
LLRIKASEDFVPTANWWAIAIANADMLTLALKDFAQR